jgi:hypothetical protein
MSADKTMFELYREGGLARSFRVVYYSELTEHTRETEIHRAMAGESLFDGYLENRSVPQAKECIEGLLARLNDGEQITADEIRNALNEYLAS